MVARLPIGANGSINQVSANFEAIEHQGDLFVLCRQKQVGAIGVAGVVRGITRRVEFPLLLARAPVCEGTTAVGGSSSRNPVF